MSSEFLVAEGEKLNYIHKCLFKSVQQTVDVYTVLWWVLWIKETEIGGAEPYVDLWSSYPCTTVVCDIYYVDELICGDCHVTNYAWTYLSVKALWWQLLNSLTVLGSVLVGSHKYDRYRRREKESHFHWYDALGEGFLLQTVTGWNLGAVFWIWIQETIKWNGTVLHAQGRRNLRVCCEQEKLWLVFWDEEG